MKTGDIPIAIEIKEDGATAAYTFNTWPGASKPGHKYIMLVLTVDEDHIVLRADIGGEVFDTQAGKAILEKVKDQQLPQKP